MPLCSDPIAGQRPIRACSCPDESSSPATANVPGVSGAPHGPRPWEPGRPLSTADSAPTCSCGRHPPSDTTRKSASPLSVLFCPPHHFAYRRLPGRNLLQSAIYQPLHPAFFIPRQIPSEGPLAHLPADSPLPPASADPFPINVLALNFELPYPELTLSLELLLPFIPVCAYAHICLPRVVCRLLLVNTSY